MAATAETATPAGEVLKIIADLCAAVEARSKVSPALVILGIIFARLGRLRDRLAHLVARISAGKPAPVRKPRSASAGASPRVRKASEWPAKYRALADQLGDDATKFADRLRAWLADPDAVAYIVANPGIGRHLRPLCRSLGVRLIPELRRKRAPRTAPAVERAASEPVAVEPSVVEPSVVEPSVVEPSVVESAAVEPAAVEPIAERPPGAFPPPPPMYGIGPPDWTHTDPGPSMKERVDKWVARHGWRWQ